MCHRQRVLQQAARERIEVALRRRCLLEPRRVLFEDRPHQLAQRLVGDLLLDQRGQFGEHHFRIEARALDVLHRIEAVGAIGVGGEADVLDVDLAAVGWMFAVFTANLVELAFLPCLLACGEPRTVGPDHRGDGAAGVAKAAGVEGLAVPPSAARALGKQDEEVARLPGRHFGETHGRRLGARHAGNLTWIRAGGKRLCYHARRRQAAGL